jgi:DNA adenine methylase
MNEQVSAWANAVDSLPAVSERLRRVLIEDLDFRKLLPKWDKPRVFMYLDPPWVPETRSGGGGEYELEMTEDDHRDLLKILVGVKNAFVMISGRRCPLYDDEFLTDARGWYSKTFFHSNSSATGKSKKKIPHTVWCNYPIPGS